MYTYFLRLIPYILLLVNLSGCQTIPPTYEMPTYGVPLPDVTKLTETQKKALSDNYYIIPKGYLVPNSYYLPEYLLYGGNYYNTNRALQQAEYNQWLVRQQAREAEQRAWEARERVHRQPPPPAPPPNTAPSPASTSTQCSAATPCKQFKLR